jgi:hypothetical protein
VIYKRRMPAKIEEHARPATPPEFTKPVGCAGGSGGLHCLSFVQACGGRLRLGRRWRFRRWTRSFLFRRPKLYKFCFQSAVRIFPISAAHFFIVGNVLHCPGGRAFHDACFVGDLENPGRLFATNCERFVLLIDCRNHSVKWNWSHWLFAWRR